MLVTNRSSSRFDRAEIYSILTTCFSDPHKRAWLTNSTPPSSAELDISHIKSSFFQYTENDDLTKSVAIGAKQICVPFTVRKSYALAVGYGSLPPLVETFLSKKLITRRCVLNFDSKWHAEGVELAHYTNGYTTLLVVWHDIHGLRKFCLLTFDHIPQNVSDMLLNALSLYYLEEYPPCYFCPSRNIECRCTENMRLHWLPKIPQRPLGSLTNWTLSFGASKKRVIQCYVMRDKKLRKFATSSVSRVLEPVDAIQYLTSTVLADYAQFKADLITDSYNPYLNPPKLVELHTSASRLDSFPSDNTLENNQQIRLDKTQSHLPHPDQESNPLVSSNSTSSLPSTLNYLSQENYFKTMSKPQLSVILGDFDISPWQTVAQPTIPRQMVSNQQLAPKDASPSFWFEHVTFRIDQVASRKALEPSPIPHPDLRPSSLHNPNNNNIINTSFLTPAVPPIPLRNSSSPSSGSNQTETVLSNQEETIPPFSTYSSLSVELDMQSLPEKSGSSARFDSAVKLKKSQNLRSASLANCPVCNMEFTFRSNMLRHMERKHHRNRTLECKLCPDTFDSKTDLISHQIQVHGEPDKFHCPQCRLFFSTKTNLTRHVRSVHEKARKHSCPMCSYMFFQKTDLVRHIKHKHPKAK